MKKIGVFSLAAMLATSAFAADDLAAMKAELDALKSQVVELKKNQEATDIATLAKQVKELKMRTGGDNVKWDIDYRASIDSIRYNMAGSSVANLGTGAGFATGMTDTLGRPINITGISSVPNKAANSSLLTNRLILGMKAAPTKDLSFIGKLSYNKAMGDTASHSQSNTQPGYANFDWVTNENATDNTVKVKEAYFIYFGDAGPVPYTASIGRRPSYDGLPGNLREGNADANSPLSHLINVEYDGASFKFDLDKVTGISGMYFKLCMGKGLTNAKQRFSMDGQDYAKDTTKNADVDLAGFIFVPYDDGQYSVHSMFFKAHNMIGFKQQEMMTWQAAYGNLQTPAATANDLSLYMNGIPFHNVGNIYGGTVMAMANGIGSGLGDFFDNTTAFVSYAFSKTQPNANGMLGSTDPKFGSSWWAGLQMPAVFTKNGKIGVEYNQGSRYWRSITYGEDTMIGSKLAARGKAWEGYYNQPITKNLDMQLRYTYISYDYTGSNGFFGDDGAPINMEAATAQGQNPVKSSSDARAYIRYRY